MSDKEDSKVLNVITALKSENKIQERTARTQIQTNLPDVLKAQRTCPWLNHVTHENSKTNNSADVHQLSWTQRNQVVVCTHRNATQQQQRQNCSARGPPASGQRTAASQGRCLQAPQRNALELLAGFIVQSHILRRQHHLTQTGHSEYLRHHGQTHRPCCS